MPQYTRQPQRNREMKRKRIWFSLAAVAAAMCLRRRQPHGDEGMWLFNNPPKQAAQGASTTSSPTRRVARAPAAVLRAVQQRRLGLVRLGRRPGDDQPPRRRRRPAEAQHRRTRTTWPAGFYAKTPAEEIKCVDLELNVLMSIEDVTERVNAAVKPGMTPADAETGPPRRDEHDREGVARQDRPAQRRGHALPGRAVPPLPLQEVHRRAAGLRPGAGHRLLRRRPGQLRVSRATTSTSASSASTRTTSRPRSSTS